MRRPLLIVACVGAGLLSGCENVDRIGPTQDPCLFLLTFASHCIIAGKASICRRQEPVLVRSTSPNCQKKD